MYVCWYHPGFHLPGRIITKGKLPNWLKYVTCSNGTSSRQAPQTVLERRNLLCRLLPLTGPATQRFHFRVSSKWVSKGKALPGCDALKTKIPSRWSSMIPHLSNCALVFITDFLLGVKFAQEQSMTGAGCDIRLFDLGPSEALANKWSLNLPWASDITNNQPGPGAFFQLE